jgi:hypothetical protein
MSDLHLTFTGQQPDLTIRNDELLLVEGEEAIEQQLRLRLKFFLGEHFLDERQGIPFYREVFVKNPNTRLLRTLFSDAVRTTPGITSVDKMDVAINAATRTLELSFVATMDTGATLVYEPFTLEI